MELQKEMEAKGKERQEAQAKIAELTEKIQVSKEEQGALAKRPFAKRLPAPRPF